MARLARVVVPGVPHHLVSAVRYVTLNPVRARLVEHAADWAWSSACAHLAGADDRVVRVAPVLERIGDFAAFLDEAVDEEAAYAPLRRAETVGRPLGEPDWLKALERQTGRRLAPGRRGRKPRELGIV
jgi:putative transposase